MKTHKDKENNLLNVKAIFFTLHVNLALYPLRNSPISHQHPPFPSTFHPQVLFPHLRF